MWGYMLFCFFNLFCVVGKGLRDESLCPPPLCTDPLVLYTVQVTGQMTPGMGMGPTPTSMGTCTRENGATISGMGRGPTPMLTQESRLDRFVASMLGKKNF